MPFTVQNPDNRLQQLIGDLDKRLSALERTKQDAILLRGSGVPSSGLGVDGNYYFRTDTPGTANQRLYVKSGGAWTGIL